MDYQSISNEELEKMVANKDGEAICELGERFLYASLWGIGGDVSAGTAHGKK